MPQLHLGGGKLKIRIQDARAACIVKWEGPQLKLQDEGQERDDII